MWKIRKYSKKNIQIPTIWKHTKNSTFIAENPNKVMQFAKYIPSNRYQILLAKKLNYQVTE